MTNEELKVILQERTKDNESITETMIDTLIANTDINEGIETISALYNYEVWDKTSKINGVEASTILKTKPFTNSGWDGICYLVKKDDAIVYFQPTDYEVDGWSKITTEERALELADAQILNVATNQAIEVVLEYLLAEVV